MKCNVCGSTNLIEGTIINGSGTNGIGLFESNDKPYFKRMFGIGGREVHSFACIHCDNLQFTVNFNEEDRQKYLEFENQPPSVTERVDEDLNVLDEKLEVSE